MEESLGPERRCSKETENRMKYLGLVLVACALLLTACEKPPQSEIDAATAAFDTASHSADVFTYAPDSLRAAQEKLQSLRAELETQAKKRSMGRRYGTAVELARQTEAAARKAVSDAARGKERVRNDAETLIENVTGAIPVFESKVWSAKRVRGIKLDPEILLAAEDARVAVADAEKDLVSGAFAAARAKALTIQDALADTESRISEAVRLSKKR
jgi:hypothetical protein